MGRPRLIPPPLNTDPSIDLITKDYNTPHLADTIIATLHVNGLIARWGQRYGTEEDLEPYALPITPPRNRKTGVRLAQHVYLSIINHLTLTKNERRAAQHIMETLIASGTARYSIPNLITAIWEHNYSRETLKPVWFRAMNSALWIASSHHVDFQDFKKLLVIISPSLPVDPALEEPLFEELYELVQLTPSFKLGEHIPLP